MTKNSVEQKQEDVVKVEDKGKFNYFADLN